MAKKIITNQKGALAALVEKCTSCESTVIFYKEDIDVVDFTSADRGIHESISCPACKEKINITQKKVINTLLEKE